MKDRLKDSVRQELETVADGAAPDLDTSVGTREEPARRPFLDSLRHLMARPEWKRLGRNRRRYDRYPCEFSVEMHMDVPGKVEIVTAEARNISNGGMLLVCSQFPNLRALRCLEFSLPQWSAPGKEEARPVMINAQIRHFEAAKRTIGVEFAVPLGMALKSAG